MTVGALALSGAAVTVGALTLTGAAVTVGALTLTGAAVTVGALTLTGAAVATVHPASASAGCRVTYTISGQWPGAADRPRRVRRRGGPGVQGVRA